MTNKVAKQVFSMNDEEDIRKHKIKSSITVNDEIALYCETHHAWLVVLDQVKQAFRISSESCIYKRNTTYVEFQLEDD